MGHNNHKNVNLKASQLGERELIRVFYLTAIGQSNQLDSEIRVRSSFSSKFVLRTIVRL